MLAEVGVQAGGSVIAGKADLGVGAHGDRAA